MELGLIYVGAGFAGLYALIAIFKTLRRAGNVSFWDVALIFIAALTVLTALVMSGMDGLPDESVGIAALITGGVLAAFGLVLMIAEAFRPQRLKQSRGVLSLGTGIMLALLSFAVPLASAYVSVPPISAADSVAAASMPAPDAANASAEATESEVSINEAFDSVFRDLFAIVGAESGLDTHTILTALDDGKSVEQIVQENNGSVERVVQRVTALVVAQIQNAAARGEITRLQAAGGILFAERGVRMAISNDLRTLQDMGRESIGVNDQTATPMGQESSFFAFLTMTPTSQTEQAAATANATASPTITAARTALPTITPPPTREPTATPSPSATRARFSTATPTASPTRVNPCFVEALYNVNLRALPALDAELLVTIPFGNILETYYRSADGEWFFVTYDGLEGWLKAEFLRAGTQCDALPVREVR